MDDKQLIDVIEHDDSFRTIRVLGEGPSGRTELVRGPQAELLVRKRIPKELANERSWATIRAMSHPLLPQVRDMYWLPDELVVILTYVDGITLGEMVQSTGPLSASEAINYLEDLCAAVGALHARGLIHRDLSPNNVVVSGGSARIIDLGNARVFVEGAQHDTTRLGTWGYAAPEQFGFAQTDARSDVFGLGSLLGFLLTGVDPGDEAFEKALTDETRVTFVLRLVVERARAFEPSARYQTVADFMTAVRAAFPEYTEVRSVPLGGSPADHASYDTEKAAPQARKTKEPAPRTMFNPVASDATARQAVDSPSHSSGSIEKTFRRLWDDWKTIGLVGKIRSAARWLFVLFGSLCFLAVGFDPSGYVEPWYWFFYPASGIIGAVCFVLFGVELQDQAVIHERNHDGIGYLKAFVKALVKWFLILLFFTVVACLIGAMIGTLL